MEGRFLGLLLGAFARSRKATVSFFVSVCLSSVCLSSVCLSSVCLSVRTEQLLPHWTDIHEIWYLRVFQKSVEQIEVSMKSDKNAGYFTWRPTYIFDQISLSSRYNQRCFWQNTNACYVQYRVFFFFKNRAVCEIMWKAYGRTRQTTDGACALHVVYLSLRTLTQNM